MYKQENPKFRVLEEGQYGITTEELSNGKIIIPKGSLCQILYTQNQVYGDIWCKEYSAYQDKLELNLDSGHYNVNTFRGVVLSTEFKNIAINYDVMKHDNISFLLEKIAHLNFLTIEDIDTIDSNWIDKEKGCFKVEYLLNDIIDNIMGNFADWVELLDVREIEEDEHGYYEGFAYQLTNDAQGLYEKKRDELELSFAKATGFYYNFTGGLVEV